MFTALSAKVSRITSERSKKQGRAQLAEKLDYLIDEDLHWIGKMREKDCSLHMVCDFFNILDVFFTQMPKKEKLIIPESLRLVRLNTVRRTDGVWQAKEGEKATPDNLYFGGLSNTPVLQVGLIMKLSRERKDQGSSFGVMSDYEFYRDKIIEPFLKTQFGLIVKAYQTLKV